MQPVDHQVIDLHRAKSVRMSARRTLKRPMATAADSQRSNRQRTEGKRANGSRARSDCGYPHGRRHKIASLHMISFSGMSSDTRQQ
jgi:hypothetical protein